MRSERCRNGGIVTSYVESFDRLHVDGVRQALAQEIAPFGEHWEPLSTRKGLGHRSQRTVVAGDARALAA